MIASLRGLLLDRRLRAGGAAELTVEVAGVGYAVLVPAGRAAAFGSLGDPVFVNVHTHVREDAIVLYGFPAREERVCFETLIAAHGVGPSVALSLLSVHTPAALRRAVEHEDLEALMIVPGIGRKTAARLLVELKSKLDGDLDGADLAAVSASPEGAGRHEGPAAVRSDVRHALAALGYGADEIRSAMAGLPEAGSAEEHLRAALRDLAGAR